MWSSKGLRGESLERKLGQPAVPALDPIETGVATEVLLVQCGVARLGLGGSEFVRKGVHYEPARTGSKVDGRANAFERDRQGLARGVADKEHAACDGIARVAGNCAAVVLATWPERVAPAEPLHRRLQRLLDKRANTGTDVIARGE